MEIAIKELNREISLMKNFIEINLKAKTKIMKKFNKYCQFISDSDKIEISKELDNYLNEPYINLSNAIKELNDIQTEIEKIFYSNFFEKYGLNTLKKLKDYANSVYFTHKETFYFGFFMGILLVLIIIFFLIAWYFDIDMDDDAQFKSIFPMFRGYTIICLYLWLLGLNVYAWNNFNINYKLCFQFKDHYSDLTNILKRNSFFTTTLVLMILCYMILRTKIPIIYELVEFIPLEMTPIIAWSFLIFYLAMPSRNWFNYKGRVYFFNLLIESFSSIFIKTEFKHIWLMDQLTSMIGPIRDIEYTCCYYFHYSSKKKISTKLKQLKITQNNSK